MTDTGLGTDTELGFVRSVAEEVRALRKTAEAGQRRVCWVTDEILGLFRNGGAGTAVSGFCEATIAAGHALTVLYAARVNTADPAIAAQIVRLERAGHRMVFLHDVCGTQSVDSGFAARSYAIDPWLRTQDFDIVHFHEFNGSGHYACLAKRQGLAYPDTLLCMTIFGSTRWAWECMESFVREVADLERDYLERKSIENADCVICHSRYMAGWLRRNAIALPARTLVQPSIMPSVNIPKAGSQVQARSGPITEVVFFGRQEVRKGMRIFVQAAEMLSREFPSLRFTVLGKFSLVDNEHSGSYVLSRLAKIPNDISFISDFDRDEALRYLKRADCLAVMPSSDDNFPGTVFEAILERLEFLTTNRGGIPEIVHPDCHAERLFAFSGPDLATAIRRIITRRPPAARLAFDQAENTRTWMDWHALAPGQAAASSGGDGGRPGLDPLVTLCVVHYDRPRMLAQTLAGVAAQTYRTIEVVLVDDGSPSQEAQDYVADLEARAWPFPFRVLRTPDIGLAAARNAGAAAAKGAYIVFTDDDNVPMPHMVETMVKAAAGRDLDVGTALSYIFSEESGPPDSDEDAIVGFFPPGGPLSAGLVNNVFGDANAIIKLDTFRQVGGFEPTKGIGAEDWDLFARIALDGHRLEVIPEPLYWYRIHPGQLTARPHSRHSYFERLLKSYYAHAGAGMAAEVAEALRTFQGTFADNKLKGETWWHLGQRPHGELQRQLLPHVNNDEESRRLLYKLALAYGRLRDAARLGMSRDQSSTHLAAFDSDLACFYRESSVMPVQGAYGEETSPDRRRRIVPLLRSVLGGAQLVTQDWGGFQWNPFTMNLDNGVIGLHPLPESRLSAVRIANAIVEGATGAIARVRVANPQGPTVRFHLMAVAPDVVWLDGFTLPSLADASLDVGPDDGTQTLAIDLFYTHQGTLDLVIATEGVEKVDFAWAQFMSLGLLFGDIR